MGLHSNFVRQIFTSNVNFHVECKYLIGKKSQNKVNKWKISEI